MWYSRKSSQLPMGAFLLTVFLLIYLGPSPHVQGMEGESRASSQEIESSHQDVKAKKKKAKGEEGYEEIVVLGVRSGSRSADTSTAPVDLFDSSDISVGGGGDMIQSIGALVPSFSSSLAFDGSAFVIPTTMRGGTSDQTLVMINGKRRHRSSVIHLFAPPANMGSHGVDIGMIPTIAVKNVEILRDGAAAQYGSDAIAGVMNFALKDDSEGGSIEAVYGNHYAGEQNWRLSGNVGTQLCNNGFLNLSMDTNDSEHLSRGRQSIHAQKLIDQGVSVDGSPFNKDGYVQTWGRPALSGTRFFANSSCRIFGDMDLYAFGNYAHTKGLWSFFYRDNQDNSLGKRNSLSSNPRPSNLDRAHEVGFTPFLQGKQQDFSLTTGIKGEDFLGDSYDFSVAMGMNEMDYTLKNSLNPDAPLGDNNQAVRDFDTTDLKQEELHFNADFSKELMDELVLVYGMELRRENYTQWSGGYSARVGEGVSGQAGTKLAASGSHSRDSAAIYADLEHGLNAKTFLQYAARFENYSDFGNTLTGKVAGFYSLSPAIGLRGSVSTGFRAPTPGQVNLTTITTDFKNQDKDDPEIEEIRNRHLPAHSAAVQEFGGRTLSEEKSFNISLGAVSRISRNMNLSADLYQTTINDRIYKNIIQGEDVNNIIENLSFYTNALDTRHTGLDLVWTAHSSWLSTSLSLAYNFNMVDVIGNKEINGKKVVSDEVIEDIEKNYPNHRFTITSNSQFSENWNFLLRGRYFGTHYDDLGTIAGNKNNAGKSKRISPVLYLDFELAYEVTRDFNVIFGAANFLNTYPTKVQGEGVENQSEHGFYYSQLSVAGYEGGSWYLKGVYVF